MLICQEVCIATKRNTTVGENKWSLLIPGCWDLVVSGLMCLIITEEIIQAFIFKNIKLEKEARSDSSQ